jgi:hypothetical protein
VRWNRVCALSHLVQYETVQPEIRSGFHEDEFDPGSFGMCPPYVGKFNRQGLVPIREQQAQGDILVCPQRLIGFDRASHCRKIRDRSFADRRHPTVHRRVGDWQTVEAAMVGFGLLHRGAECNGGEGLGGIPH